MEFAASLLMSFLDLGILIPLMLIAVLVSGVLWKLVVLVVIVCIIASYVAGMCIGVGARGPKRTLEEAAERSFGSSQDGGDAPLLAQEARKSTDGANPLG